MTGQRVSAICILSLLFILLSACGLVETPLPPDGIFPTLAGPAAAPPTPRVLTTYSQSIGPAGGTIVGEGWRIVVPDGALADTIEIAVNQLDAAQYLDSIEQGVFLRVTLPITQLARPAQVRVALPDWYTPEDAGAAMSLLVDEQTGEMLYEPVTVELNDGQPELVLESDHFSSRLIKWLEWLEETFLYRFPPEQADPIEVPYYSQAGTKYCWAAMSQMVAESARHSADGEVYGFIGVMNVDPQASWWQLSKTPSVVRLRVSSALGAELTRRTGKAPERIYWTALQQQIQVEYIQRELAFKRHPVGLFTSKKVSNGEGHAFVLVGYPDRKSFYTLDPREPKSMYKVRTLAELGLDGTGNTTVVIPLAPAADRPLISINIGNNFAFFAEPSPDPSYTLWGRSYYWRWDFRSPTGYAVTTGSGSDMMPILNALPGEVTHLVPTAPEEGYGIEVANAHLGGAPVEAQVQIEIQRQGPSSSRYVQSSAVTVPPSKMVYVPLQPIPVDEFRDPSPQAVSYTFKATVIVDGKPTDEASFNFVLDPKPASTPEPAKPAVSKCICPNGLPLGLDLDLGCADLIMPRMDPDWNACYQGCLIECGCDLYDTDLSCACECVMGK
ncbi:MAG: hypothetical protein JXA37_02475 [Chloroflexia bacterium]|nr:hypothetical protein [Chloroflexia bacterium]